MQPKFRMDNTEGYSQDDLDELNRRFDAALADAEPIDDDIRKSHEDYIAEQVQQQFDAGE